MSEVKVYKRSLINKYFTDDMYIKLYELTISSGIDNNERYLMIQDYLKEWGIPYTSLGCGTNRCSTLIDGYAVKFALDKDGSIDNRREMLYSKDLQPYVTKCYECTPSGLISVHEYVEIFTQDEFRSRQVEMREILEAISEQYLVGDIGITTKNYVNWGTRLDGTICILDYAYCYNTTFGTFTCTCDDTSIIHYDKNFVDLVCPTCGRKYTFGDIRRRITRKGQEEEIGDIRRIGYNLKKAEEMLPVVKEFEPVDKSKKKKKEKSKADIAIENYHKMKNRSEQDWDYPESQRK